MAFRVIMWFFMIMWLLELSACGFQSRHVACTVIRWLSELSCGFQSDHVAFRVIMWLRAVSYRGLEPLYRAIT